MHIMGDCPPVVRCEVAVACGESVVENEGWDNTKGLITVTVSVLLSNA